MGRKKKKKKFQQFQAQVSNKASEPEVSSAPRNVSSQESTVAKKSANTFSMQDTQLSQSLRPEYATIKNDLIRVVILNLIFFGALIALYYYNLNNGVLDNMLNGIV